MAYLAKLDARYVFTFGWGQVVVVVVGGGGGGWLLVAWLLGWFVRSLVRLFVCLFVRLYVLLLLSSSSLLFLFLLLFSHENKLMDFMFFSQTPASKIKRVKVPEESGQTYHKITLFMGHVSFYHQEFSSLDNQAMKMKVIASKFSRFQMCLAMTI